MIGEMGGMQGTTGTTQNNTESAQDSDANKTTENQNNQKGGTNILQLTSNLRDMQGMFKALNTQIKRQKDEIDNVKKGLKPEESCPYCLRVDFGQSQHFKKNKTESDLPPIKQEGIGNKYVTIKDKNSLLHTGSNKD